MNLEETGALNDVFLQSTLKTLFRLPVSIVLLEYRNAV